MPLGRSGPESSLEGFRAADDFDELFRNAGLAGAAGQSVSCFSNTSLAFRVAVAMALMRAPSSLAWLSERAR